MTEVILTILIIVAGAFLFFKGWTYVANLNIQNRFFSFLIKGILFTLLLIFTGIFAAIGGIILGVFASIKTK